MFRWGNGSRTRQRHVEEDGVGEGSQERRGQLSTALFLRWSWCFGVEFGSLHSR